MAKESRIISFHELYFDNNGRRDPYDISSVMSFLMSKNKQNRAIQISASESLSIESITTHQIGSFTFYQIIFKYVDTDEPAILTNQKTFNDRKSDKQPNEGSPKTTHVCIAFNRDKATIMCVEEKKGKCTPCSGILKYLNKMISINKIGPNIVAATYFDESFIKESDSHFKKYNTTIFTTNDILGQGGLGIGSMFSQTSSITVNVKHNKAEGLFSWMSSFKEKDGKINRIKVIAEDNNGCLHYMDTSMSSKEKQIVNVIKRPDGTIESINMFSGMRDALISILQKELSDVLLT